MVDITLCENEECPIKEKCFRYTAEASSRQSYACFPHKDGDCDYFWDNASTNFRKISRLEKCAD